MNAQISAITDLALAVANTFGFGEVEMSSDIFVIIACDRASVADRVYSAMISARDDLGAAAIYDVLQTGANVTVWRS